MKMGQAEILGFMVIILLLFFTLLLYFRFSSDEESAFVPEAEQSLEVSHLLTVIEQYTLCEEGSLGDAIQSCAEGGGFVCEEDACTLVREEVSSLVALHGWEEDSYMFSIGEELYSPQSCSGNSFADSYSTSGISVQFVYCYS